MILIALLVGFGGSLLPAAEDSVKEKQAEVLVVTLNGVINPVAAENITRA